MKKRRIILIFLIVLVTAGCIYLGIQARYRARLIVTQLAGEGNGYVLETSENNLIVIDGGTENDVDRLQEIIQEKSDSNTVMAWFLTSPVSENTGALLELLKKNEITIGQIYVSLNSMEWYEKSNLDSSELSKIEELLDVLYAEENRDKVTEIGRRAQLRLGNYIITALEVKDENLKSNDIADQTVLLNVDNTFKSMNFLGNIGTEEQEIFIENDKDVLNADVVQFSENGKLNILDNMNFTDAMISVDELEMPIEAENIYTKENGEITIEVW